MITLEPSTHRKLVASLRLLGSDKEGERQAALCAALRLLPPGVTLADVVERGLTVADARGPWAFRRTGEPWQRKALAVLTMCGLLDDRETEFARNIARARYQPTDRQLQWLDDLVERVGVDA